MKYQAWRIPCEVFVVYFKYYPHMTGNMIGKSPRRSGFDAMCSGTRISEIKLF
jgi:hypothetical protein